MYDIKNIKNSKRVMYSYHKTTGKTTETIKQDTNPF